MRDEHAMAGRQCIDERLEITGKAWSPVQQHDGRPEAAVFDEKLSFFGGHTRADTPRAVHITGASFPGIGVSQPMMSADAITGNKTRHIGWPQ
jgi:hypothetical protein